MANTSATGGPLTPDASPPYGLALNNLIQAWLVPVIGELTGDMVRVYDQSEPPNIPDAGVAWAAVKVSIDQADTFPFVGGGMVTGQQVAQLQRHERIEILASFYDLGSGGLAQHLMALLRDGLAVGQNLEPLLANNMGLVSVRTPVTVPSLLKQRWMYRVDLPFGVNRAVVRNYAVRDVASGPIILDANVEGTPNLIERIIPVTASTRLDLSQPGNSQYVPGI